MCPHSHWIFHSHEDPSSPVAHVPQVTVPTLTDSYHEGQPTQEPHFLAIHVCPKLQKGPTVGQGGVQIAYATSEDSASHVQMGILVHS